MLTRDHSSPADATAALVSALSQGMTEVYPVPLPRPATQTSVPAAGSLRGQNSPRPQPARHKKDQDWWLPRAQEKPYWEPQGHPSSHCGLGSYRRLAARAPLTVASPQAATPPTLAASHPTLAATWTCGGPERNLVLYSACPLEPAHLSPDCVPAHLGRPSTRCPLHCDTTMTHLEACARPPETQAHLLRAALTTVQPQTWVVRHPRGVPPVGWELNDGDRQRKARAVKLCHPVHPLASPGKQAAPMQGHLQLSFCHVQSVADSR